MISKWVYSRTAPYGHPVIMASLLLLPLGKTTIHFLVKKNPVNKANFFGPLVTLLTGFHCNNVVI